MIRKIYTYPDPVLKKVSEPVEEMDEAFLELIDDMFETMYDAKGVGLAAPQVGVSRRVIVLDVAPVEENKESLVLVNPEIVEKEGLQEGEEGCLSVPEFRALVKRASRVVVVATGRDGESLRIEEEGFMARALQHEIDHLDGILFVDHLSAVKRDIFRRKYLKKIRSGAVA